MKTGVMKMNKENKQKLKVGFYGVSGCAGCLLTVLYEDCFKEIVDLVDIKAFPFIKSESYKGKFDVVFVEGTVCFDEDIEVLRKLRKKADVLVALGSCATTGGVPPIKNFLDPEKTLKLVYPVHNELKEEPPTPLDKHVKVDYYLPQCPPSKTEIVEFVAAISSGLKWSGYESSVCLECRQKGNHCLLEDNKICLGPVATGGCGALCPTNNVTCYGCRGPFKDANIMAFIDMIKKMGYTEDRVHDKMKTFAGLQFKEEFGKGESWLEK